MIEELVEPLGHRFGKPELLVEALTHPSVEPAERGRARHGYERLEFLGDRVLGLVVAEWLWERFPAEPEGVLDRRHSALVRRETLAAVAEAVGLGRHLRLSPGEAEAGGRANPYILANAGEAVIAALYLDAGLDAARRFVRRHWAQAMAEAVEAPRDPKAALQEWAQGRGLALPRYRTVGRSGPDHDPRFDVQVSIEGFEPVTGSGASKRAAEKAAAAGLMDRIEPR